MSLSKNGNFGGEKYIAKMKRREARLLELEMQLFGAIRAFKGRAEYLAELATKTEIPTAAELVIEKEIKQRLPEITGLKLYTTVTTNKFVPLTLEFDQIEEEAREDNIQESQKIQNELTRKLHEISTKVSMLSNSPKVNCLEVQESSIGISRSEDDVQKQREAELFVQRMKKQERNHRLFIRQQHEKWESKIQREAEEETKLQRERELLTLAERKKATLETYQKIKQKREEDERNSGKKEEIKSHLTLKPKKNYLYKQLEDKFKQEYIIPSLKQRKWELAKRRYNSRPLRKEELESHFKRYELLASLREEERKNKLRKRRQQEENLMESLQNYHNSLMDKVASEDAIQKQKSFNQSLDKRRLKEKNEQYSHLIKEICTVKINKSKAEELKHQIELLKHPVRESRDTRKQYDLAVINCRNSKHNISTHSFTPERSSNTIPSLSTSGTGKLVRAQPESLKTYAIQQKAPPRIDYLKEMRKKREEQHPSSRPNRFGWKNDIFNSKLNTKQKYDLVIFKANTIEEDARQKELMLQAQGGADKNPDMGDNISDMYLDAIRAKLAMLENL